MPLKLSTLMREKIFSGIKLLAGKQRLSNMVEHAYLIPATKISDLVHKNILAFVCHTTHHAEELPELLEECIRSKLAGLVIVLDKKQLSQIPPAVIARADEAQLPLFMMQWRSELLAFTGKINYLIYSSAQKLQNTGRLLKRLVFSSKINLKSLQKIDEKDGLLFKKYFCVAIVTPSDFQKFLRSYGDYGFRSFLENAARFEGITYYSMLHDKSLILLATSSSQAQSQKIHESVKNIFHELREKYDADCSVACGNIYTEPTQINRSYEEAEFAKKIADKILGCSLSYYNNLGIYKLLRALDAAQNKNELDTYCRQNLQLLIEHDKSDDHKLCTTLKAFLENNGNLVDTATATKSHRNTVFYRKKKIEQILQADLSDGVTCMELLLALRLREYLQATRPAY